MMSTIVTINDFNNDVTLTNRPPSCLVVEFVLKTIRIRWVSSDLLMFTVFLFCLLAC